MFLDKNDVICGRMFPDRVVIIFVAQNLRAHFNFDISTLLGVEPLLHRVTHRVKISLNLGFCWV